MEQVQDDMQKEAPAKKAEARKKSNKGRIAILAAIALVVAGGVTALLFFLNNRGEDEEKTVYDSDAFFLRETAASNSKYGLFNQKGDKLTDFEFTFVSAFINDYAIVRNADNKYGIIDHTGKMTVDFETYGDISTRGGLFEVKVDGKRNLIGGDGKEIYAGYTSYIESYDTPYVAIETGEKEYKLFSAVGEELLSFESESRPSFATHSQRTASSLRYDKHIVLLNNKTLKVLANQEVEKEYSIMSASKDVKSIVLADKAGGNESTWAVYNDGKFVEFGDKCTSISLYDDSTDNQGRRYLTCKKDNNNYLIRNNDVTDINVSGNEIRYAVFDENHYASFNSKDKKVAFYADGAEKTSFDGEYAPIVTGKGYYIRDYKNKRLVLYGLEGEEIYKLENVSYGELYGPDKNGNIIVHDAAQQNSNERYYLVNKKGEQVSEKKYSSISRHGSYYSAFNYEDKTGDLLDKDGKIIVSGNYTSFDYYKNEKLIFGRQGDQKVDLIDAKGRSVRGSFEGRISVGSSNYFSLTTDDGVVFYTFEGKEIHRQAKE